MAQMRVTWSPVMREGRRRHPRPDRPPALTRAPAAWGPGNARRRGTRSLTPKNPGRRRPRGFTATGEINLMDFGVSYNGPIPGGGVLPGEKVQIILEIEAFVQTGG
jgi:hypothetical protein